jgi:hypothetical protein
MMKSEHCFAYQINLLPLSTQPQNRTTVGVSIHISAPSCRDGPAWLCTGAPRPCICRQPPGKHHLACQNDDSDVANGKVKSKATDEVFPQYDACPAAPRLAVGPAVERSVAGAAESRNHRCKHFRNWCRSKRLAFSWFSPKENHTSRPLSRHINCESAVSRVRSVRPLD